MLRETTLPQNTIAAKLGCSIGTVARARARFGIQRPRGEGEEVQKERKQREAKRSEVVRRLLDGESQPRIARALGLHQTTVSAMAAEAGLVRVVCWIPKGSSREIHAPS